MGSERAEELLARRLAAGLTQEQLGVAAGVTAKTIASIERGLATRPQRTTLEAIDRALSEAEEPEEVPA
jgi:transcriptional regulator with XRE-family HTH domain